MNVPYIPGNTPPPELPLGRFLPPIPRGMVRAWCQANLPSGVWVLDPFGLNPLIPLEIAAAGHPVLVTVNNPIHAFMLKILASAPAREELIAALQDLAISAKGNDRMEPYIRSLYHVNCLDCDNQIEAETFVWKKDADQPYAALVNCPVCGAYGEQTLNAQTLESLTPLPPKQLHLARALNRITDRNDSLRTHVENALNTYPARPIIILQTIINKLESLEQTPRRRDLLIALILTAADQGNTMWAYPSPRNRPRQIVTPTVYQEKNLWKALVGAVEQWQFLTKPIPISDWKGATSQAKGIYLFQGRIKELHPKPESDAFAAVLTAIPRPNQALWTLSALWTGWIWGKDAIAPIRQVLSRQRYDWNWHTNALRRVFGTIKDFHHTPQQFWGLIAENEPMFLLATLLAAESAGYQLTGFAQSPAHQMAQCTWSRNAQPAITNKPDIVIEIARNKIKDYLRQKGEPATYQQVHAAAVTWLAHENKLAIDLFLEKSNQATSETQKWIERLFREKSLLTQVAGGTASLESGDWFLANPTGTQMNLIDHVEKKIVQHLVESKTTTPQDLKKHIYQAFPGIFTPEDSFMINCLDSYAEPVNPNSHSWKLRENEIPAKRRTDITAILKSLIHIAHRLDYQTKEHNPLLWYEGNALQPSYRFSVFASAIVSQHIYQNTQKAQTNILVLPGSRANLLAFKKQRDPVLKQTLDHGFLIVKFRLVRDLEANPLLNRSLFKDQISSDPLEYQSSQLVLF
jgi:hypothetical protein